MNRRGVTMMEIVVVLVIFGILVAMAAPRLNSYVRRTTADAVLNELVGNINYTRMLAVRSGRTATLNISGAGTSYTITTLDANGASQTAKRVDLTWDAPGYTVSPTGPLRFNSRGILTTGEAKLYAQGRGQRDSVFVLITGRPYRYNY